MLVSLKIKKAIEAEIKSQRAYLKALETQEKNYSKDLTEEKQTVKDSIANYEAFIKE